MRDHPLSVGNLPADTPPKEIDLSTAYSEASWGWVGPHWPRPHPAGVFDWLDLVQVLRETTSQSSFLSASSFSMFPEP